MNTSETDLMLRLFHAPGVTSALLRRVLEEAGNQEINKDVIVALCSGREERQAVIMGLSGTSTEENKPLLSAIADTQRWLESKTNRLLFANDIAYPPLLRQIPDYPPLLFVKGDVDCLRRPMLAIVGSRNSTAYGRSVAYRIAADLADMGLLVCSGLASGIDTQAHVAALDAGANTVAVLGNGLNSVYPAVNRGLADRITDIEAPIGGALLSELPLQAGPVASHFPQRNRIISGLSLGVCVVEASMRSGSLITARLALEQNREVFAVPGSINSPVSRGCHRLIRQGAVLTESAEDIVEHIRFICQAQMAMTYPDFVSESGGNNKLALSETDQHNIPQGCETVYLHLCEDAATVDTLMIRTGLEFAELSAKLLQLELAGVVGHHGNRWWRQ